MIQRKQTLWLLFALTSALLTFFFPFYSGDKYVREHIVPNGEFVADVSFPVFVLTLLTILCTTTAIGLYKNRKIQFRIGLLALLFSILVIVFYFKDIKVHFSKGHLLLSSIFAFVVPVFIFLALRGIRRDEKLVKSLNKLR
ncbi:MAG: hypothetical protein BWZ05_00484 [Bacteroidetes bacterium ADurb.BinA245]|jgi:hypothetical protein|nr:DUF4293 domain-containing protein [Chitinophagaceae bacterium]OPZ18873.1 MAG: hypothetical protein BWZ05_00484 [Bacteroidetes bacterium ADurb.BinA245]HMW67121.1 DUF4293 domain-containing protein [Chitinophagaceae bacterium]HND96477.1 DUF4293 domain-containing protein [Chitinophagaceae bacterium]HNJ25501.1 DUF4293 domain-containing protein [Chitinophagaceae bacterium]